MRESTKNRSALLVLVGLALFLAACGGGGPPDGDRLDASLVPTQGVSATTERSEPVGSSASAGQATGTLRRTATTHSTTVPSAESSQVRAFLFPSLLFAAPGELIEVAVWVSPGSEGISGGEVELSFPASAFEAVGVVPGDLFGETPLTGFYQLDADAGIATLALARRGPTDAPTDDGTFAVITLRARDPAAPGNYKLELRLGLADDAFTHLMLASVNGGTVTIEEAE